MKLKKYVIYFIALVISLIYGNVAHDVGSLAAGWMAGIPFAIIAFAACWVILRENK